jgi:hypothetical protein
MAIRANEAGFWPGALQVIAVGAFFSWHRLLRTVTWQGGSEPEGGGAQDPDPAETMLVSA